MESSLLNLSPLVFFVLLFIFESLFFHVLNRVGGIRKVLTRYASFVEPQLGFSSDSKSKVGKKQRGDRSSSEKIDDEVLRREDMEIVMESLGLFCGPDDEKLKGSLGSDEISNLFDEREPSLEELKGAFDVFDENKDGFIDAEELHRVLSILGLKEGLDIENCRMMIGARDENGDDRIDFNEFVKAMENGFC